MHLYTYNAGDAAHASAIYIEMTTRAGEYFRVVYFIRVKFTLAVFFHSFEVFFPSQETEKISPRYLRCTRPFERNKTLGNTLICIATIVRLRYI